MKPHAALALTSAVFASLLAFAAASPQQKKGEPIPHGQDKLPGPALSPQEALKKKYLALGRWDDLEVFYAESGKWDEFIRVLEQQEAKETRLPSSIFAARATSRMRRRVTTSTCRSMKGAEHVQMRTTRSHRARSRDGGDGPVEPGAGHRARRGNHRP